MLGLFEIMINCSFNQSERLYLNMFYTHTSYETVEIYSVFPRKMFDLSALSQASSVGMVAI